MKRNWKVFLLCLFIPLAVGGLATLLSGGMSDFASLNQPPLSPPAWVFPVVWSILYLLMGYASYRVLTSGQPEEKIRRALLVYGAQLLLNFLWPIVFFRFEMYLTAFFILLALWLLVFFTMWLFSKLDETAGDLLLPYLIWITFAGYLNLGVFLLN
jgi:tryptophan-rich sensory protein